MNDTNISSNKLKFYEKFQVVSTLTFVAATLFLFFYYLLDKTFIPWLETIKEVDQSFVSIAKFVSFIAKESGFAVLIAFFLNLSVEWINRRRHADQESSLVKLLDDKHERRMEKLLLKLEEKYDERTTELLKDVFQTVYERYIEKGVFKVIDDHVLKKDLMRRNYKVSMTISPVQNSSNLVHLEFNIRYEAVNITDRLIKTNLCGALIDVTPEHEEKCRFVRAKIDGRNYNEDELKNLTNRDNESFQWTLTIPGSIDAHKSIDVELVYRKVGPRDYAEVICSTVQMDSMEIDVLLQDPELRVNAVSLHPENETRTSINDRDMFTSWRINHAILPGQGAIVFWHPKRATITGSN